MSEPKEKGKGLFGRFFKGGAAAPGAPEKEATDEASIAVSDDKPPIAEVPTTVPVPVAPAPKAEPVKQSWFQRLKSGLGKTSSKLTTGITDLFSKRKLDAETLDDLEDLLIQSDLGLETTSRITAAIGKGRFEKGISAEEVRSVLSAEVERVLAPVAKPLVIDPSRKPHVIMMVGVNGTGKTTTIGKLATKFRAEGKSVLLAAGDTFRAAAIDQLKVWGERTGCPVVAREVGGDSSGLAFDALKQAQASGADVLLLDTAGRLQNKQVLMEELEKVTRVLKKIDPSAPHDVVLVLDATTGQNALQQVEVFRDRAGVTGLVMTKLDGTARGGILVAIAAKFGLPVHAIGVGESADDLQPFSAQDFANAIAGT
ncbi:signal recognition particle-docking protein FtsY [Hyphomicrobium sp. 802]|uniref:signal recognition particle-docking protein FtsY n=1 Tax=Hyphomicrobium sp. 802 TaxID=1112272 RepID=UPI0004B711B2|nr:signal recognition particle-docking protein FtsY [Hyphomicrobium sp. 802]